MRKLTKYEIDDILDFIIPNPNIPQDTSLLIVRKNKKQLIDIEIYPKLIPILKNNIKNIYLNSQIQPGECVGIITAQSIGEKQTQSNLNSVDWVEKIFYMDNNQIKINYIGKLIDFLLDENKNIEYINDTQYLDIKDKNLYIPSADSKGFCNWYKIEAVTRHLPKGDLIKITTKSGRNIIGTQDLSFVVLKDNIFVPINGSELKIGDIVPLTIKLPQINVDDKLDLKKIIKIQNTPGYIFYDDNFSILLVYFFLFGIHRSNSLFISDLQIVDSIKIKLFCEKYNIYFFEKDNELIIRSQWLTSLFKKIFFSGLHKIIPFFIFNMPKNNIFTFLRILSLHINNFEFTKDQINSICILYSYFNIIFEVIQIKRKFKLNCITNSIFFKLNNDINTNFINDVYKDSIIKIERIKSTHKYVYDLTVENTRYFQLYNGITVNDTFHKAGSSDKQPVVSKFSELLNATNKPKSPSYFIYFHYGYENLKKLRNVIKYNLVEINFKKIIKDIQICLNKKDEIWYEMFYFLYNKEKIDYEHCLSLTINMDILYEYKLTLEYICINLEKEYKDIKCIFSPDCYGIIDIFVNTNNIQMPEKNISYITEENKNQIYLEDVVEPNIQDTIICGIQGINDIYFLQKNKEWIVETENDKEKVVKKNRKDKYNNSIERFKKVLGLPFVDETRTISNNLWDIYYTFGIEAARQYMIDEFSNIMKGINLSHVMLLVDKMTFTGTISSISRYSMRRDEAGPFGKASFEETLDNFLTAGAYGQEENIKGVSGSIICGKKPPIGTGLCELTMNLEKLCMGINNDI